MLIRDQTEGCSGAEISSLCQEAAILTMQMDMNAPHVCPLNKLIKISLAHYSDRFPMTHLLLRPEL